MGFDVNFNNKPIIKEAQSMQNDGGSGNLGYFEREEKKKKENEKSIFNNKSNDTDTFELHEDEDIEEANFSISKFIFNIRLSISNWIKKLFLVN